MRIAHLSIRNFRGISEAGLTLPPHAVLIGDNNSGKSSVIEAIDLVLGPDRIKCYAIFQREALTKAKRHDRAIQFWSIG